MFGVSFINFCESLQNVCILNISLLNKMLYNFLLAKFYRLILDYSASRIPEELKVSLHDVKNSQEFIKLKAGTDTESLSIEIIKR